MVREKTKKRFVADENKIFSAEDAKNIRAEDCFRWQRNKGLTAGDTGDAEGRRGSSD